MSKFILAVGIGITIMSTTGVAFAQLEDRCRRDDQLNADQARGRNAWSRRCGYITVSRENALNDEGEYQVYTRACATYPVIPAGSDCQRYVPTSEAEACIYGMAKLGTCYAGCYTPTQRVAFNGEYSPVPKAAESRRPTVTALARGSQQSSLRFGEQPIRAFVRGDTGEMEEDVFLLETSDGGRLEVTSEHPMVTDQGAIVRAKSLRVGDKILRSNGNTATLSRVTVSPFKGTVWNVQPVSHNKTENILDAEGFLTGSIRFQNEWASDNYRLSLRDDLDVSGF